MTTHPGDLLADDAASGEALPVWLVDEHHLQQALAALPESARRWAEARQFTPRPGRCLVLPAADGSPLGALAGAGSGHGEKLATGALADQLGDGIWRFDFTYAPDADATLATLGWLLSGYRFTLATQGEKDATPPRLLPPSAIDPGAVLAEAEGIFFGRNLVNTPANELGPAELAAHARALAEAFDARFEEISGALLKRRWPLVHAVGAAAAPERAPRLIRLQWGEAQAPRIAIVGKGVCFDSGGLDIKPSSAMRLMKKDMGGAAAALALARMIMALRLPVRLDVLVPAVENAVSGPAFRPGDVLKSRAGLTVEVGNTDAEGRLILADALHAADEEKPQLIIDFATLTGAARVALGPTLPAAFGNDDELLQQLRRHGEALDDPLWPMPLWQPYMEELDSPVADMNNIASNGFAGAIIAALFLSRFVRHARHWLHLDIYAWNARSSPARPRGGEVQAARAALALIRERFAAGGSA